MASSSYEREGFEKFYRKELMRIFKFGGASVKDAQGVKNLLRVLKHEGFENTLVVVSAMGKMTNAFEKLVYSYLYETTKLTTTIDTIKKYHETILIDLFEKDHEVYQEVNRIFARLHDFLNTNTSFDYDFVYDQIVPNGELISTKIVHHYLQINKVANKWLDIRTILKTDSIYRNATVNWESTSNNCKKLDQNQLYITQGFIGRDSKRNTTTLGREGSDFTAGILAYCLDAESVTIWKDVEGVLNADPRVFDATILLEQISYQEAIEMAFYGASVIHPKTIKPLENKKIPLFVRSFELLETKGTVVSKGVSLLPKTSCFIVKKQQVLVSISAKDFSFMIEENLSHIFNLLHQDRLKVNLIQNSAISFSVCLEDNHSNFNHFYDELHPDFEVKYNENVTLYTVRHFTKEAVSQIEKRGVVLLKQTSRDTIQLVVDEKNNYAN